MSESAMIKAKIKLDPITTPRDHARNVGFGPTPEMNKSNLGAPETVQTKALKAKSSGENLKIV